jgi:hypothetical protein
MQGYNAYYGNPFASEAGVDPGFRRFAGQHMFEAHYTEGRTTEDGRYFVPDGFDVLPNSGCKIDFAAESEYKVSDYKKSLETKASFHAGLFGASFSASSDYKSFHEETHSSKRRAITSAAQCTQFTVTRRTYEKPTFTKDWNNAIATLPSDFGDGSAYFDFLDAFGTHMMTGQVLGSRFGFTAYFDQKGWATVANTGVDVKTAAGYEGKFKAGGSLEHGKEEDAQKAFESSASSLHMITLGKQPIDYDPVKWANAVNEEPMPIWYELDSICNLIDDHQKQSNCNRALGKSEYCTKRVKGERHAVDSCEEPPADPACLWHMDCHGTDACVEYRCYETAEVRQYWHGGDHDWSSHVAPAWSGQRDDTGKFGLPFYAFTSAVPGAQQVHQYWHDGDRDWSFHFPPAWSGERDDTGKFGPPFYAFTSALSGAKQVNQYWHDGDRDWSSLFPPAWSGQRDDTGKFGPPFYAFELEDLTSSAHVRGEEEHFGNRTVVV